MIWYRHWLEMRWLLVFMLMFVLFAAWGFFSSLDNAPLRVNTEAARALGPAAFGIWTRHLFATATLVMASTVGLASPGLISCAMTGFADRSVYYTLTLPVSRTRLVLTRFVMSWVSALGMLALMFGLNAVSGVSVGASMPWQPMAVATLAGAVLTLPAIAAAGLGYLWVGNSYGSVLAFLPLAVLQHWWRALVEQLVLGRLPWTYPAAAVAIAAVFLWLTVEFAKRKEF